jgi:hypothetical protein
VLTEFLAPYRDVLEGSLEYQVDGRPPTPSSKSVR